MRRLALAISSVVVACGCTALESSLSGDATGCSQEDGGTAPSNAPLDVPVSAGPVGELPDLLVDEEMLGGWYIDEVDPESPYYDCAVAEGCLVRGEGNRQLLKFDVGVVNLGSADLVLGDPTDHPEDFEYASCHDHLHYKDFAKYELKDSCGKVRSGVKQAFCLIDLYDFGNDGDESQGYDCGYQGISRGWGDIYDSSLDCQWIDITGVPAGEYSLTVNVNAEHKIPEAGPQPNTATITLEIP